MTLTEWSVYVVDGGQQVHVGNRRQLPQCLLGPVAPQHGPVDVIDDQKDVIAGVWNENT